MGRKDEYWELQRRVCELENKIGTLGLECKLCGQFRPIGDLEAIDLGEVSYDGLTYRRTYYVCKACLGGLKAAKGK